MIVRPSASPEIKSETRIHRLVGETHDRCYDRSSGSWWNIFGIFSVKARNDVKFPHPKQTPEKQSARSYSRSGVALEVVTERSVNGLAIDLDGNRMLAGFADD